MKRVLVSLLGLALFSTMAWADVPDPAFCTVTPSDALNGAVLGPDCPAPITASINTITVHNSDDNPIPNALVAVTFTASNSLCPNGVFTGTTDALGIVTITLAGGGCAHVVPAAAVFKANGVTIRDYQNAKSPDYDGAGGNGKVELPDLIKFSNEFLDVDANECHDYDNNGNTGIEDLIFFSTPFVVGNECCP